MSTRPIKYYLDENGDPQPTEDDSAWMRWFETFDRTIASDREKGVLVETFFLGLDQGIEVPQLFETVVTLPSGAHVTKRYPTKKAALAGHDDMLDALATDDAPSIAALNWGSR